MPKEMNTAKEQLSELEKLTKKVIRKSLKDATLDYTCQITISSLEPGKIKYATMISAPSKGVEPITYVFDNFKDLQNTLIESEKSINREKIEMTFHEDRIIAYKNSIAAHEARIKELKGDPSEENV